MEGWKIGMMDWIYHGGTENKEMEEWKSGMVEEWKSGMMEEINHIGR